MAVDLTEAPPPPRLRPLGPIVRQEEFGIWAEAQAALEAADHHHKRMRAWTLAAYRRERERGRDAGLEIGRREAAELIATTTSRTSSHLRRIEQTLPTLVLDVIQDLLGHFDPGDLLIRAVRHALTKLHAGADIRLRVSPEQSALLRTALSEFTGSGCAIEIEVDPTMDAGECVLRSQFGNIELGIEAQIAALRRGLLAQEQHGDASRGSP